VPNKKTYITTPIYYVNGVPHVGSATTTLVADALARYYRQRGDEVFFLTGVDEHAQKVADAAAKVGATPQAFVDDISQRFKETWSFLGITNDDFIRTSEDRHKDVVQEVFRRLRSTGDIYAGKYEGWYSVSDETFFRDSEVENGKAIESGAAVERVTEDVYYFRLSAYGDRLLSKIEAEPDFLLPDTRRNEVISFIKEGLRDIAVSRRNTGWGIPVPDDDTQVVYVWFDALINYLSISGWPNNPEWDTIWPADVHLVGKEIYTRFHATLWPAMLMGLDLPLPKHVLGHGWWLIAGEKGAKSKGNIPTSEQAVEYLVSLGGASQGAAVDALRYYLIKGISFTGDAEFALAELVNRYNSDLANDLGNLLNRSLNMLRQYTDGVITGSAERTKHSDLAKLVPSVVQEAETHFATLNPGLAIEAIWRLVKAGNKEIDTAAPWKKNKEGDTEGVADALYTAVEALRIISVLVAPFLPYTSTAIRRQLGIEADSIPAWQSAHIWGELPVGTKMAEPEPIFPRIQAQKGTKVTEVQTETKPAAAETVAAEPAVVSDYITIDDFMKVKLKVGEIKSAEAVPKANKLLKLTVDVGEEQMRTILSGIAESYNPDDLIGRKIVVVMNLAPRTMRGIESQGMLLAADDAEGLAVLLQPDRSDLAPGSNVH